MNHRTVLLSVALLTLNWGSVWAQPPTNRPRPLGTTPVPTPEVQREYARFVKGVVDPVMPLDLIVGRTRILILKEAPTRILLGDDRIADYNLISPRELAIQGKRVGSTVLYLWFRDPNDPAGEKPIGFGGRVGWR